MIFEQFNTGLLILNIGLLIFTIWTKARTAYRNGYVKGVGDTIDAYAKQRSDILREKSNNEQSNPDTGREVLLDGSDIRTGTTPTTDISS